MASEQRSDAEQLAEFGYKQELHRTLGSFSSFAAGFSYISILTGMFQTSYLGFYFAGPAFIWAWLVVLFGQMMVALQFSELAAHYPLAGSVYQWSKQVAGKSWSWNTGWMYLCAQIVTVPAVALAWQVILPQISTRFQVFKCTPSASCPDPSFPLFNNPDFAKNAILLGIVMITLTTIINVLGISVLSRINNVGVAAELVGASGLVILFLIHANRSPSDVLTTTANTANVPVNHAWGYLGALLVGAIMPLYVMYGFDSAGSLAEETDEPAQAGSAGDPPGAGHGRHHGLPADPVRHDGGQRQAVPGRSRRRRSGADNQGRARRHSGATSSSGTARSRSSSAASPSTRCRCGSCSPWPATTTCRRATSWRRCPAPAACRWSRRCWWAPSRSPSWRSTSPTRMPSRSCWAWASSTCTWPTWASPSRSSSGGCEGWPNNLPTANQGLFKLGGWALVTNGIAILYGAAMVINLAWPRDYFYGTKWYQQYGPILGVVLASARA